jgi:hypothetical protein
MGEVRLKVPAEQVDLFRVAAAREVQHDAAAKAVTG